MIGRQKLAYCIREGESDPPQKVEGSMKNNLPLACSGKGNDEETETGAVLNKDVQL